MSKFKIGDIVIRINNRSEILPIGTISKITGFLPSLSTSYRVLCLDNNIVFPFTDTNFELLTPRNWCIQGSPQLGDWQRNEMKNSCNCDLDYPNISYYLTKDRCYDFTDWDYSYDYTPIGKFKISFDDFIKYVWKNGFKKQIKFIRRHAEV